MNGTVRPLVEADVPRVADLHRRVFRVRPEGAPALLEAYRRWFGAVFLDAAGRKSGIVSLVHEGQDGSIGGFLGVVPRPMVVRGERLIAAVSSQFVVDERQRSQLVGVRLLRAFFEGPQDLSIADESVGDARRLWEAMGGETALLPSLRWTIPLSPCALAVSRAARRRSIGWIVRAAMPLARAADSVLRWLPGSRLRVEASGLEGERGSPEALVEHLSSVVGNALRTEIEPGALRRALARAAEVLCIQPEITMLRDARGRPVGAYVHAPRAGEVDEVLLFAATPPAARAAVQHLAHRAYRQGAIAVAGRLDRRILTSIREGRALFTPGPWVLVHAARRELVAAFERGDAFFPRLAGELCLRFEPGDAGATEEM